MSEDGGERAKRWLESVVAKPKGHGSSSREVGDGGLFNALTLWDLRVSSTHAGRALCSFRVPAHLTDADGNWISGAMSTVIDLVGAAAILSEGGDLKVSANMDITYLSPARIDDEVEVDARCWDTRGGCRRWRWSSGRRGVERWSLSASSGWHQGGH